ncbi:ABC transporter permease [Planktosalinus lacus]|uniref:ABC transporter permease n=1 Tax=Planktosalinus lacus TaxID=1526573 RepID=A0A8J2Y560_9FLAO|nr:ABC transporter permease [Planktosalinus lacus]GGD83205.1 ABC transporter permease [Planktosalinus lacus]
MFDLERWQEIFEAIRKNKLRTFLTGLSVASGIFILVILLATGKGIENGVAKQFERDAASRISVWTGVTSQGYKGLNPGRFIQLKNNDFDQTVLKYQDQLEYKSSIYRIWSGLTTYNNENGSYRIEGALPDYQFLENESMTAGRFINNYDQENYEKVAVIGQKVYTDLFKGKKAIGEYIDITGIKFKVIGVFTDPGGEREEARIMMPLSTSQRVFNAGENIRNIAFTLQSTGNFNRDVEASNVFTTQLEDQLKTRHTIAPTDNRAITVRSNLQETKRFYDLNNMISLFFWAVGICTIIAGVVGVSNIMLIIVKERTKEIGIRKAIGAEPWSIIWMIMHESIFITAIAGFLGLIFGLGLLELAGPAIETEFISNPSVDFNIAISTVFILIIAGAIAGFFPAYRAAKIKPIEALNDD